MSKPALKFLLSRARWIVLLWVGTAVAEVLLYLCVPTSKCVSGGKYALDYYEIINVWKTDLLIIIPLLTTISTIVLLCRKKVIALLIGALVYTLLVLPIGLPNVAAVIVTLGAVLAFALIQDNKGKDNP